MTKPKTLDQLRAEKERAETQLLQEQHKLERLKNRKKYLEKGERTKHDEQLLRSVGGARYGSIVASARILTDLAFQRNVQPALDTIQPYVVVLMHLSGVVDRLPVAC